MSLFICGKNKNEKFSIGLIYTSEDLAGATIDSVVTSVLPANGLTLAGSPTIDGSTVIQKIEGGTPEKDYEVTFLVTLSSGVKYEDKIIVSIEKDTVVI